MAVVLVALALFLVHYDHPSYLPDDGIYAYSAERLIDNLKGPGDPAPLSLGYVAIPNAASLWAFGERLVSLRFPLALLMMANALLVYLLLLPRGRFDAVLGALAISALGPVQFMNPSASWYALTLCLLAAWVLTRFRRLEFAGFIGLGLIVGLAVLTRSLSGALIASGVVVFAVQSFRSADPPGQSSMVRLLLAPAILVLGFMSTRALTPGSWLLFAAWPTAIALWLFVAARSDNRRLFRFALGLVVGISLAAVPLVIHNLHTGAMGVWLRGTFVVAPGIPWAEFSGSPTFSALPFLLLESALIEPGLRSWTSVTYWFVSLLSPMLLGVVMVRAKLAEPSAALPAPAIMASFFAVSALHLQIPIYLIYVAALCMVGLLGLGGTMTKAGHWLVRGLVIFAVIAGWTIHAGKSHDVAFVDLLRGERDAQLVSCDLDRSGLRLPERTCRGLDRIVGLIETHASPSQPVLVVPNSVVLNFLADRPYPLESPTCPFDVNDREALEYRLAQLRQAPPAVVVVNSGDKYYSALCRELVDALTPGYSQVDRILGHDVFLLDEN